MPAFVRRIPAALALLWIAVTICFLLGISVAVFANPAFPLNLGLIRTTGLTGLFATLLPAVVGIVGLALWRRGWLGPALVAAYCIFWAFALLGSLPLVWHVKKAFCIQRLNFCITTPWVTRLAVTVLAMPFLLAGLWAARSARKGK